MACSVRLVVVGVELVASCTCGWSARCVLRHSFACEQVSALVGQHVRVEGLLVELAELIGPQRAKRC
jgi:hypothetical protein